VEEVLVQTLELGSGQLLGEIGSVKEILDIDGDFVGGTEGSLGLLSLSLEFLLGSLIGGGVFTGLPLESLEGRWVGSEWQSQV